MNPADLLVLGGSGFIGARTAQIARARSLAAACTYRNHPAPPGIPAWLVDTADPAALRACLEQTRPRAVLYCAVTFTPHTLDEAAQWRVSVEGLRALIAVLGELGHACRLVYVSTNAVFSGADGSYKETDLPDPEARTDAYRYYGLARRAGEQIALAEWPDVLVARTANVDGYDAWGALNPRLRGLVDSLRSRQPLARFIDRSISPTLVDNVADALLEVASPAFALPPDPAARILHLAGCQPMTDYEYALRIARRLGVPEAQVTQDRCLPSGSTGRYSIALDVARTQSLLHTRLLDVDGILSRIFH